MKVEVTARPLKDSKHSASMRQQARVTAQITETKKLCLQDHSSQDFPWWTVCKYHANKPKYLSLNILEK